MLLCRKIWFLNFNLSLNFIWQSKHSKLKIWKSSIFQMHSSESMPVKHTFHFLPSHFIFVPFIYIVSVPIICAANQPGVDTEQSEGAEHMKRAHSIQICTNTIFILRYADEVRSSNPILSRQLTMMAASC